MKSSINRLLGALTVSLVACQAGVWAQSLPVRDDYAGWTEVVRASSSKDRELRIKAIRALRGMGLNYLHVFSGTAASREFLKVMDDLRAEIDWLMKRIAEGPHKLDLDRLRDLITAMQSQPSERSLLKQLDHSFVDSLHRTLAARIHDGDKAEALEAIATIAALSGDHWDVCGHGCVPRFEKTHLSMSGNLSRLLQESARSTPDLLIESMATDDPDRKAVIAEALAKARVAKASAEFKRMVASKEEDIRAIGIEALAEFQRPDHLEVLVQQLARHDIEAPWCLSRHIEGYGVAAVPVVRKYLSALNVEGKLFALQLAGKYWCRESARLVEELLGDTSTEVLSDSISAAKKLPLGDLDTQTGSAILARLNKLLTSSEPGIAAAAAGAIRHFLVD